MNFIKGVIVGSVISTGAWMLYSETSGLDKKKMMKMSKKVMKNMGIM